MTERTKLDEVAEIYERLNAGMQVRTGMPEVVEFKPSPCRGRLNDPTWMEKLRISAARTIDRWIPMWLVHMMYELGWWGYWICRALGL
ncbi:hypothetical protein [Desulfococcus sp.]|uniref:hypothetical protein n=1 Tax=Desulfococcus sp. TaxID=2025834 RepID=UPI00359453EA